MRVPPALSIVFPAFNEARRLPDSLERTFAWLESRRSGLQAEVLVVDDGSTDGTADRVRARFGSRPELRLLSYGGNRGKGFAVRHGILAASGERVLMTDADLSTPIEELERLEQTMEEEGLDIAIGSRALGEVVVAQRGVRSFAGKIYNRIMRAILLLPFHDTQCGFKLLRRERCLPVVRSVRIDRVSVDVELLFLARRSGLRAAEIPVRWYNSPESKVSFVRDASRMFFDVLRIRWWSMTGGY